MKLFRRIRQSLLSENRLGRYLLYAFGEIILVVIGILIAVRINNYNEAKLQKKEERKVLESLDDALKINQREFHRTLGQQHNRMKSIETILFTDLSPYSTEQLDSIIGQSAQSYTFNPSLGIFDALINSGKIELVSNDSLKNDISKLRDVFSDYQEEENEANLMTRNYLHPFFIKKYRIDPSILGNARKRTKEEQIRDKRFYLESFSGYDVKNMYSLLLGAMDHIVYGEGATLKSELENILERTREEL